MVAALGAVAAALPLAGKVLDAINPLLDRFFPDPQKAAEVRNALLAELAKFDTAQLEVNKAEAQTGSIFIAGWRPFIGWTCGVGIAYSFLIAPIATGIVQIWDSSFALPAVDSHLWELIFGMLGMGALRSFDKMQGTGTVQVGGTSPSVKLGKSLEGAR